MNGGGGPKWAVAAARRRRTLRTWALIATVAVGGLMAGLFAATSYGYIDHRNLSMYGSSAQPDQLEVELPETGLNGIELTEDAHITNYTCTRGWMPTGGCNPFGDVNLDGILSCDTSVPPKQSGYCQCSHGLITRREGCAGSERLEFTCDSQCDGLNRNSVHSQRAAREASASIQRLRHGWWRKHLRGSQTREGDLQAMSNTAKCQLSRALHSSPGLADDMRVVESAAIEDDFRPWSVGFSRADVWAAAEKERMRNVLAVIEVKAGRFAFADRINTPRCRETPRGYWADETACVLVRPDSATGEMVETGILQGVDMLLYITLDLLNKAVEEGLLQPPDCLFLLDVQDDSLLCFGGPDDPPGCVAPWLSLIRRHDYQDVLVPQMHGVEHPKYEWPWEEKKEVAFWHGTDFCRPHPIQGHPAACARYSITELTWRYPDYISLTNQRQVPEKTPEADHAKWKYLVQLDGVSASYRLQMLMHTGSAILKQESPWSEYYYRFLRPCRHYIPFWIRSPDDLIDEVVALRLADDYAKELAETAQAFALRHLGRKSRLRYWQKVLDTYAALERDSQQPAPAQQAEQQAAAAEQQPAAEEAAAEQQPAAAEQQPAAEEAAAEQQAAAAEQQPAAEEAAAEQQPAAGEAAAADGQSQAE